MSIYNDTLDSRSEAALLSDRVLTLESALRRLSETAIPPTNVELTEVSQRRLQEWREALAAAKELLDG